MRQIFQNLKSGAVEYVKTPIPAPGPGQIVIATRVGVISAGTERMLLEFGRAGLVEKARKQPEKVRQTIDKAKTDGLIATYEAVVSKLSTPLPMGYSMAGEVVEVGEGVEEFSVGDRVVSNGSHAEMVVAPLNLCAPVPDQVTDEAAAYTVIGAIALQGVRLIGPQLGETYMVSGLGLVGLLTVQLLRANGCQVIGADFSKSRLALAAEFGAATVDLAAGEDPVEKGLALTGGRGVDGVVVAAATKSSEPMAQAAKVCRQRGKIVLVGVTGLELARADFYEKELTFQVSCSYGPGRYDPVYEEKGVDYPIGYVRWTEKRNFEAVLDMMAARKLTPEKLTSHRYLFDQAEAAYETLTHDAEALGVTLSYTPMPEGKVEETASVAEKAPAAVTSAGPRIGFIGAGNYATRVLAPAFRAASCQLAMIASAKGASAALAARSQKFGQVASSAKEVIESDVVDAVVIATRHDSHASLVCDALRAGKSVFVEKPLALWPHEIDEIEKTYRQLSNDKKEARLMVGFNRRFSPLTVAIKEAVKLSAHPATFVMTVNAGAIPKEHWTQDRRVGGGRIIGEGCHFIDLLRHLAGGAITGVVSTHLDHETATLSLTFEGGSTGTIHYLANGHRAFPKERLEVFCGGKMATIDNFRKLRAYGWPGLSSRSLWRQDKGQDECAAQFVRAVAQKGESPIRFEEIIEVARATLQAAGE